MVKLTNVLFFIDFVFGLYFVSLGLNLLNLQFFEPIEKGIFLVGGIFLIISGIVALRRTRRTY